MRYVFIVNPVAGKGQGEAYIRKAAERCFENREDYEILLTTLPGEAGKLAEREAQKGDDVTIFACGGDGTVFEVLNGLYGYDNARLGVVPTGSANDFLKFFPKDKAGAFMDIADQIGGKAVPTDLIKFGDNVCLNICSTGMDAVVAENMSLFKRLPFVSGPMAYNLAVVKVFLGKLGIKAKIWVDGELLGNGDHLFAVCANGPCYGGGYRCAPEASPFDAVLDYVLVRKIPKFKILELIKRYKKGDIKDLECCTVGRCSSMKIVSEKPFAVNLDGEIQHYTEAEFSIIKSGVNFVVPASLLENVGDQILTKLKL